jgi:hypothetical protein
LNESKLVGVLKSPHNGVVNYVEFMKSELIMITGSYESNSLYVWQYDELEDVKFRIVRRRNGLSHPIKKLGFYGDEGYHVIASSFAKNAELRDYFIWNEAFEGNFSVKRNKTLEKMSFNTENIQDIP